MPGPCRARDAVNAPTFLIGAVAGLVATAAMIPIELAARARYGLDGLLDWRLNQTTAARFLHRSVEASVVAGLGLHFAHGLFLGIFFVLLLFLFPTQAPAWVWGVGFGAFLFALTLFLYKPVGGRTISWGSHPSAAVAVCLVTHLVYGVVLAVLLLGP